MQGELSTLELHLLNPAALGVGVERCLLCLAVWVLCLIHSQGIQAQALYQQGLQPGEEGTPPRSLPMWCSHWQYISKKDK